MTEWLAPSENQIKFNVDASCRGNLGISGIGGVLNDHKGNILLMFSKNIGIQEPNIAEFLAIREAIVIMVNDEGLTSKELVVESDSAIAVSWICNDTIPWKLNMDANIITNAMSKLRSCSVKNINREANSFADRLARLGVDRHTDMRAWIMTH